MISGFFCFRLGEFKPWSCVLLLEQKLPCYSKFLHTRDKQTIAWFYRVIWIYFSRSFFLLLYFTRLKAREIKKHHAIISTHYSDVYIPYTVIDAYRWKRYQEFLKVVVVWRFFFEKGNIGGGYFFHIFELTLFDPKENLILAYPYFCEIWRERELTNTQGI